MAQPNRKRRSYSVRNSPIHGRGVFALVPIPKGTRIVEYKGELITDDEADRRYADVHEHSPHTMLFSLENNLVIDATATPRVGSITLVPPTARSKKRAPVFLLMLAVTFVRKRNSLMTTIYN
jgi:SET domain-containing protein